MQRSIHVKDTCMTLLELTFAERLVVLRGRAHLTQAALAAKAGCPAMAVYRMENGITKQPNVIRVAHLAKALGVSFDLLWSGQEQQALATFAAPQ